MGWSRVGDEGEELLGVLLTEGVLMGRAPPDTAEVRWLARPPVRQERGRSFWLNTPGGEKGGGRRANVGACVGKCVCMCVCACVCMCVYVCVLACMCFRGGGQQLNDEGGGGGRPHSV